MRRRDQRPGLGVGVERSAEADPVRASGQFGHEVVVDRLLDDQPRPRRTDLPGVQEHRRGRQVERGLQVGVGEHHVGVLAAELQRHPLHGRGTGCHQQATHGEAARERDHVDPRVLRQWGTHLRTGSQHEVPDSGRQPRLLQQVQQQDRGGRREFARLEHEGVTGEQGRGDLPGGLQQRVVPRGDQAADADRLVHDPADRVGPAGVDHAPGVGARDAAVVPQAGRHVGDVVLALDDALARVQRLGAGELLGVALQQVGHPQQEGAAFPLRGAGPGAVVESRSRRGDRGVGVGAGPLVDRGHQGAVGRAVDLPHPAGGSMTPLACDVEICHMYPSRRIRWASAGQRARLTELRSPNGRSVAFCVLLRITHRIVYRGTGLTPQCGNVKGSSLPSGTLNVTVTSTGTMANSGDRPHPIRDRPGPPQPPRSAHRRCGPREPGSTRAGINRSRQRRPCRANRGGARSRRRPGPPAAPPRAAAPAAAGRWGRRR